VSVIIEVIDRVMRQFLLCIFFLLLPVKLLPQLLINEFSSANISGLTDEDGEYNDWIEIYNRSSSEISLGGYHLSDDASFLKKWTFPAFPLKPWSYILIFASDKNRSFIPLNYKTIIPRGTEWQYLVPTAEPGNSWKYPGFNASSWKTGKSGFGYGDNDDSTVLKNIISVFIRKEFNITNLIEIGELVMSIDYDDGFIAYINGKEIARSNLGSGFTVPFNQVTGTLTREATMYNKGFPENYYIRVPSAFLVEGTNVIAIQGHNSGSTSDDLSLIPMLTIGRNVTDIIDSVPDYIKLRGRKMHTNFKISDEGETLILSRPDSSVIDSVSPKRLVANLSYGRKPDGENNWFYFAVTSPGAPNISKGFGSLSIDTIIFSAKGGYYPGGLELQLSSTHPSDSIFFTLDGSEPAVLSSRYKGSISITGSKVVRARSLKSDRLPGAISTNTYVTRKHSLPVVSISTDPVNLWDYNTGIYVLGPNASTVSPYFGANFWQNWEKKGHMELFDTSGIKQIDQDIGIKIYGAYSRSRPQKSLALYARKEYGKGSFDYKVFKDKPIEKFEALVLRNGGNDAGLAIVRDGLTSTLVRDMDIDRQAFQPAVVYLNGEYWGIQDIREKINSNYLAENHMVNPDNVNLLVSNSSIVEGSNTSYTQITNYLNSNTLENGQNYQEIKSKIDINNYIQYQLTQVYIDNRDWPGNNIKFWNTNDPGSLWRWIIYDTDFGFGFKGATAYTFNTLDYALVPDSPSGANRPWATLLFRRMISNTGFRNEFANQYADRINRNLSAERVSYVIDSIRQVYLPEITDHLTRWNLKYDNWVNSYSTIKTFASNRPANARLHLQTKLALGEMIQIKVEINQPEIGTVRVNSIIPYKFPFYGIYFKDLPIKLTAVPSPGYRFVRWEMGSSTSQSLSVDYNMSAPGNFRAVFESARHTDIKIVINEINYQSPPAKDTKDWIELYNAGNSTVNLKNWVISDGGPDSGYVFQEDYILQPGMYIVVCHNLNAFRSFWPQVTNSTGDFEFGLSSSGDKVNLYDHEGNLVDFVDYEIDYPWPEDADATGNPIELTDAFSDNNKGNNWKTSPPWGTPGTINFQSSNRGNTGSQIPGGSLSCYPSPFQDYTTIRVEVADAGRYRIEIYNIQGNLLNTISDQNIEAGEYYIDWHGNSSSGVPVPEGVYIIRLTGETHHLNTRVIRLK
jgi:hypothetical protein